MLDICACPGSKSFGSAIRMENVGEINSFDLHEKKLSLVVSGAQKLGITILDACAHDGRDFMPQWEGRVDRVLCDVPCSGFGVVAKKPELRYKDPAVSSALPDIQLAILETACRYVKSGGTLVYSTCTIFPEENEKNVARFLSAHPEFCLTPFRVGALDCPEGQITLLPDRHPTDGFFIAKLTKKEPS
jgi:16S rRNA (cytosine967-C5)-methyltransferase